MKNNIEIHRKARKLTFRALAAKSGVGLGSLCDIQNGKTCPSVEIAYKIADALGKTISQVFPRPEHEPAIRKYADKLNKGK